MNGTQPSPQCSLNTPSLTGLDGSRMSPLSTCYMRIRLGQWLHLWRAEAAGAGWLGCRRACRQRISVLLQMMRALCLLRHPHRPAAEHPEDTYAYVTRWGSERVYMHAPPRRDVVNRTNRPTTSLGRARHQVAGAAQVTVSHHRCPEPRPILSFEQPRRVCERLQLSPRAGWPKGAAARPMTKTTARGTQVHEARHRRREP